jgi:SAM-dependent methyltransferase
VGTGNWFGAGVDAERYARARPAVHASALAKFRQAAGITARFQCALDVGCGTGHSTVALMPLAESVVGVDPSAEMLAHSADHPKVSYQQATAEDLPFPDQAFDLITAGLAFHWFEAGAFLAEARRLLCPEGWLVVYASRFTGEMLNAPAFGGWFREFLARYPTPARNPTILTASLAEAHGLVWTGQEVFADDVEMTLDTFVDYELSTTNVIAAAQRNVSAFAEAEAWMRTSLTSLIAPRRSGTFRFAGHISLLRKHAPS